MISYSRIKCYTQCPAKYKYKYKLKLAGGATDVVASSRGTLLHSAAEEFILGLSTELPVELQKWEKVLTKLRDEGCQSEVKIEIPEHDIHGTLDTLQVQDTTAEVGDWKSGQVRDYSSQLKFYAMLVFYAKPQVNTVSTRVRYIDKGKSVPGPTYSRKELPAIHAEFKAMIDRMNKDPVCAPNPSSLCAFCPYSKKASGICKW